MSVLAILSCHVQCRFHIFTFHLTLGVQISRRNHGLLRSHLRIHVLLRSLLRSHGCLRSLHRSRVRLRSHGPLRILGHTEQPPGCTELRGRLRPRGWSCWTSC
ncbi:unnamed protein product [Ixodes pacificus]